MKSNRDIFIEEQIKLEANIEKMKESFDRAIASQKIFISEVNKAKRFLDTSKTFNCILNYKFQ